MVRPDTLKGKRHFKESIEMECRKKPGRKQFLKKVNRRETHGDN